MKGIWTESETCGFAEFKQSFNYAGGGAVVRISAAFRYAAFINGVFVSNGQYADIPEKKRIDEIDVSSFVRKGENELYIVAMHTLEDFSIARAMDAYLVFEVLSRVSSSPNRAKIPWAGLRRTTFWEIGLPRSSAGAGNTILRFGAGSGKNVVPPWGDLRWQNALSVNSPCPNPFLPKSSHREFSDTAAGDGGGESAERLAVHSPFCRYDGPIQGGECRSR
ncbi:MAG: hypothetical protein ACLR06_02175 [Christensenellaceae bacterium]